MSSVSVPGREATPSRLGGFWNPKAACAMVLALVFLCGAAAGALAMDFGVRSRILHRTFDTPTGRVLYLERMQRELNLTPEQSEQIQSVLDDFWQYYHVVLSSSKERVEQLLNDQQRQKFEKMLQQQPAR